MDIRPDPVRLAQLDLSGFVLGDSVLFCPVCPDCHTRLHITKVTPDLIALKDRP